MSTSSEAVVARVLIEERWTHVARDRGASFVEISALSGKPISAGGLGRQIAVPTLKRRARGYVERRRARLEAAREDERLRRIALAEIAVDNADRKLAAATGEPAAYASALRAYERAEARLAREEAGVHVPIARWMRESVDLDIALEIAPYLPKDDRSALRRSLAI